MAAEGIQAENGRMARARIVTSTCSNSSQLGSFGESITYNSSTDTSGTCLYQHCRLDGAAQYLNQNDTFGMYNQFLNQTSLLGTPEGHVTLYAVARKPCTLKRVQAVVDQTKQLRLYCYDELVKLAGKPP